jgi:hypothetical protein
MLSFDFFLAFYIEWSYLKFASIKVPLYAEGVDDAFGSACFIKINSAT